MTNISSAIQHHPLIGSIDVDSIQQPAGFLVEFLGVRTRIEFVLGMMQGYKPPAAGQRVSLGHPGFDEEYFEWVDIFEAVEEADSTFVMVELGAGYGRWLARGATIARRRGRGFCGVGVEAEPDHFRWLKQNLRDNGVSPSEVELTWAAIGSKPGFVPFWIGNPDGWYGQSVAGGRHTAPPSPSPSERRKLKARSALGRPPVGRTEEKGIVWVPTVTLEELIEPYKFVDLIDLDVQGLELDILSNAIDTLNARVRRVHIGTHSAALESGLRAVFTEHAWENLNDYPRGGITATPYGDIAFGDGVQTWRNPCVGPPSERRMLKRSVPTSPPVAVEAPMRPPTEEELRSRITTLRKKNAKLRANVEKLRSRYVQLKQKLRER
jgi:FkbM family methyltransferase